MADIKALAEQLVGLTVKEVNELAQVLEEEYGIKRRRCSRGGGEDRVQCGAR